jgi:peptidoglycan/xylan/chitin deacetylase (PgdA/CDA1 family)
VNYLKSNILKSLAFYFGYTAFRKTVRRISLNHKIFILYYHKISPTAKPYFGRSVKPFVFEKQIKYLKRRFEIIDFEKLHEMRTDEDIKKDLVLITFDDGYRDAYFYAYPILKKYDVAATIFLTTDYIGTMDMMWPDKLAWVLYHATADGSEIEWDDKMSSNDLKDAIKNFVTAPDSRVQTLYRIAALLKDYDEGKREETLRALQRRFQVENPAKDDNRCILKWEEVKEMSQNGVYFGSHTKTHPVLSRISIEKAEDEIAGSKETLENILNQNISTFAYPYGKKNDYSEDIITILRNNGYKFACSTVKGSEALPLQKPLELKRKPMSILPYIFL